MASSSCTTPDTNTVGSKTVTYTATDNAGNTISMPVTYNVIYGFTGFSQPVSNLLMFNSGKAGSAVPMKFTLTGQSSLDVLAAGYPKVTAIDCSVTKPMAENATTVSATSNSSLKYDGGSYSYIWKTDRTPGCYQFDLRLNDNTDHYAFFKLR